jgi:Domain of unknown function (DUF4260)
VFLPGVLLRLEGLAVFGVSLAVYLDADFSVLAFVLLLLVPDLSIAAYALGRRTGAAAYNLAHLEVWPLVLLAVGIIGDEATLVQVALIWLAHIGIDRCFGLGFKYADADFKDTHLGRV